MFVCKRNIADKVLIEGESHEAPRSQAWSQHMLSFVTQFVCTSTWPAWIWVEFMSPNTVVHASQAIQTSPRYYTPYRYHFRGHVVAIVGYAEEMSYVAQRQVFAIVRSLPKIGTLRYVPCCVPCSHRPFAHHIQGDITLSNKFTCRKDGGMTETLISNIVLTAAS